MIILILLVLFHTFMITTVIPNISLTLKARKVGADEGLVELTPVNVSSRDNILDTSLRSNASL